MKTRKTYQKNEKDVRCFGAALFGKPLCIFLCQGLSNTEKLEKVQQTALSKAGEAMELSVNPLTVPTSCAVLIIKILIIILTATNKLILIIV